MASMRVRGLVDTPFVPGLAAGSALALALAELTAAAAWHPLGLGAEYLARVTAGFAAAALVVAVQARRHAASSAFGVANQATLVRVALVALALALVTEPARAALAWYVIGLATVALVLDGIDGKLARRYRCASPFGARFDMETDTVLIVVLSVLAWRWDKAGVWILASGLLRYAFVLAGYVLPALRRALPPSRRRQTVCIVQAIALLAAISPLFPPPASHAVAAIGLALLAASFGVDIRWLLRAARGASQALGTGAPSRAPPASADAAERGPASLEP
jgi:phosphatidylglycerophosphate synthase